jgi:hypothetical protein
MFRYPEFFAKINARLGFRIFASPKFVTFTRPLRIIEMILAGISAISTIVMFALN